MDQTLKKAKALNFLRTPQSTSSLLKHMEYSDSSNRRLIKELKEGGLIKEAVDDVPAGSEKYYVVSPELAGGVIPIWSKEGRALPLRHLLREALAIYHSSTTNTNRAVGAIVHLFRYSYFGPSKDVYEIAKAGSVNEADTRVVLAGIIEELVWFVELFQYLLGEDRLWDGEKIATKFGITAEEVAELEEKKNLLEIGEDWEKYALTKLGRRVGQ